MVSNTSSGTDNGLKIAAADSNAKNDNKYNTSVGALVGGLSNNHKKKKTVFHLIIIPYVVVVDV